MHLGKPALQAISCKAIYDLFTKLIDPATNTGHVVAAPIQKYVQGALLVSCFRDPCCRTVNQIAIIEIVAGEEKLSFLESGLHFAVVMHFDRPSNPNRLP